MIFWAIELKFLGLKVFCQSKLLICDNKCGRGCGRYSHILGGDKMEMCQISIEAAWVKVVNYQKWCL